MSRLARTLAIPSRSALSAASSVVDWLTLGVLGAATVALVISSRRAKTADAREVRATDTVGAGH